MYYENDLVYLLIAIEIKSTYTKLSYYGFKTNSRVNKDC